MKIKLDENLPGLLSDTLQAAGHDVHTVLSEGLEGKPDPEIVDAARLESRVLITLDKGIANLNSPTNKNHAGIVLLRLKHPSASALVTLIQSHISVFDSDLPKNRIIVLSPGSIRIR